MAKKKVKRKEDLRSKSINQLKKTAKEEKKEWFKLKMDLKVGRLKDNSQLKRKRKEIARIKTIIREKELVVEAEKSLQNKGENKGGK